MELYEFDQDINTLGIRKKGNREKISAAHRILSHATRLVINNISRIQRLCINYWLIHSNLIVSQRLVNITFHAFIQLLQMNYFIHF